jgi:hypothetical protein
VQGIFLHIDASAPDSVDFSNELRVLDVRFFRNKILFKKAYVLGTKIVNMFITITNVCNEIVLAQILLNAFSGACHPSV